MKRFCSFVHIVCAMFLLFVAILYAENSSPVLFDYGDAKTLQFKMELNKTEIVPYEPFLVTISVHNVANRTLQIMLPLESPGRFKAVDPSGKIVSLNNLFADVLWTFGSEPLKPNESQIGKLDLSEYINIGDRVGNYKVQFTYQLFRDVPHYQNGKESVGTKVSGEIVNRAKLRVILPQSPEDRAALELFAPAIKKWREGYKEDDILKNYQLIIHKYPTSRYAEWSAFQMAAYYTALRDKDPENFNRAIQSYRDFVQKYPQSFYFERAQKTIEALEEESR